MGIWFSLDVDFLNNRKLIPIGEDYGPAAPAVLICLMASAKAQEFTRKDGDPGSVRQGYRALARACFMHGKKGAERARGVVHAAVDAGFLQMVREEGDDFEAIIVKWTEYQRPSISAAERQRRYREKKAQERLAEASPSSSGDVTEATPPHGRDGYTETETKTTTDIRGGRSNVEGDHDGPPLPLRRVA
jgi:hypothetical protein